MDDQSTHLRRMKNLGEPGFNMSCPVCDCLETPIVYEGGRYAGKIVHRRRQCAECRATFTTHESAINLSQPQCINRCDVVTLLQDRVKVMREEIRKLNNEKGRNSMEYLSQQGTVTAPIDPEAQYNMTCISCGSTKDIQWWPHRNGHGMLVGFVFACPACKHIVEGMRLDMPGVRADKTLLPEVELTELRKCLRKMMDKFKKACQLGEVNAMEDPTYEYATRLLSDEAVGCKKQE